VLLEEVRASRPAPAGERAREGSDAVRTNFAAHLYSYPFAKLARHPRMVEPIMQLFGEELYMHQFKINGKMAFDGDVLAVAPGLRHLEERRPDARRRAR